jgi:hypothetical protein
MILISDYAIARMQDFTDRRGEIAHARARHDDRVSTAVRFLGDAQEFPAIVFPKLNVKTLALNLEFLRVDDAVHIENGGV